ncbi:AAA domain-containing protein [Nocardia sp. NPDC051833]|uniref:bifunctional RecB family nuclease/DEAD/DEAH box helicase n=1 Tax=Nocardia sp. NPDC051833 TaxID=3155674 RepID=UPI0034430890
MSGDRVIGAVGDLVRAADCEFALLRALDAAIGNLPGAPDAAIPVVRAAEVAPELLRHFGDALIRVPSPELPGATPAARIAALTAAAEQTAAALRDGAAAILGAVFFDGRFACGADLLVRDPGTGQYTQHIAVGSAAVGLPASSRSGAVDLPASLEFGRGPGVVVESGDRAAGEVVGPEPGEFAASSRGPVTPGVPVSLAESAAYGEAGPVVVDHEESAEVDGASVDSGATVGAAAPVSVPADDFRALRRELAAGRTPFERATASVGRSAADGARAALRARLAFAACGAALAEAGVGVDPSAYLWTEAGAQRMRTDELARVYPARRARVERIVEEKLTELLPVQWGDPRYLACGRCATCRVAASTARDLLLVAGIRPTQRARLREAGVLTIDRLATTTTPVTGLAPRTVTALRRQAEIQLERERTGEPTFALRDVAALGALPAPGHGDLALIVDLDQHGTVTAVELSDARSVVYRSAVTEPPAAAFGRCVPAAPAIAHGISGTASGDYPTGERCGAAPTAGPGFSGDPSETSGGPGHTATDLSAPHHPTVERAEMTSAGHATGATPTARPGSAADPSPGARQAITGLPAAHRPIGDRAEVAPAGPAATGASAADVLDELLDIIGEHRAVDPDVRVYHYGSAVRTALLDWAGRLGTGADLLDELLADGALFDLAPIVRTALLIGEQSYDLAGLAGLFPAVESRATTVLALRDWLLARADEAGVAVPGTRFAVAEADVPPSLRPGSLEAALTEFAAVADGDAARAAALTAAILGYHRRERQPRWWAHIDRLGHPVGEWADAPGVLVAEWGTVDTKWHRTPLLPTMRRYLTLTGRLGTGATLTPGTQMVTIYDGAAAAGMTQTLGRRATATATVLGCAVDANFDDTVRLEELLPAGCPPYDDLPAAIAPGPPDGEAEIEAALELTAQDLLVTLPEVPENAVYDLLLRRAPRLRDGLDLPQVHGDIAAALASAVGALDASYLAVHGPPGTGKTGITGRAIERLVTRHRWRIGVVAQSHAVIERIFDAVVEAGLLPELVAKKDVASVGPEWSAIDAERYPRFLDNAVNGCVIGGTTADFVDETLIAPGALDLLVIADAGASSLADTVAVAVSARNLLLIGDPVPARALAAHPEPVQVSALDWLCEGAATLPAERGYFLDRTWRMHPAVCEPVSASCYAGRLRASETITLARDLAGIAPGVSTVVVDHRGSATESDAEAREVVRRVRALLGETWTSGGRARKLHPHDVFVVAPYAAQVARIRTLLARAKIEDVLVGTPDRFRGREAAVVLLSMTTSTPADAPFGMRALLSRTVIHATLCRAMWKAIVIRSPLLTEYLPDSQEELTALAEFLRLD